MEERARARIEEIKKAREAYAQESQRTLYAMDVAIGELQHLLEPEPVAETTDVPPQEIELPRNIAVETPEGSNGVMVEQ